MNLRYKKIKPLKESKFSLTTDEAGSLLTDAAIYAEQFAKNARKLVADLDTGKITTIPWGSQVEADFSDIRDRMEKIFNSNIMKESLSKKMNESWKNFVFIVKCNDGSKELIKVVAEDKAKAEEYAKKMYAQNHTTYADDRYNKWYIEDSDHLNEAFYGMNQIEQFVKMADAIGLKTMGDFKDFMDREGQGKDVLTALYDYLHDEIGDLNFHAKDESLKEALNENDAKYTATGRKKLVSDETMSLAVEAARTIDPNAKRDYDDDFIYGDDGHGGSTWVILLNGDGKAYSTWGRNAVLTSKVEKAVNDAADAYWADFDKRWGENNKHYIESKDGSVNESLKESYLDNLKNPDYWQHQVDYQLEKFGRVGGGLIQDLDEAGFYLDADNKVVKKLHEDTIKTPKIEWTFIKSKEVEDSDGFLTDYTWYEGSDGTQVMVFGDNDIYKPEDGYFDVTFTDRKQAEDWFNSY